MKSQDLIMNCGDLRWFVELIFGQLRKMWGRVVLSGQVETEWKSNFLLTRGCGLEIKTRNEIHLSSFYIFTSVFLLKKRKKNTAPRIPEWSPTSVLPEPELAWLRKSDGMRYFRVSMAVSEDWVVFHSLSIHHHSSSSSLCLLSKMTDDHGKKKKEKRKDRTRLHPNSYKGIFYSSWDRDYNGKIEIKI